ncbi:MAG: hypothetical protein MI799_10830 [Desulfobacterales bacterium]|nr:hypothetical protein [Desulfobacterales bacterium]
MNERELYQGAVILKSWAECLDNSEISLYSLNGWGHVWPGKAFYGSLEKGHPLKKFDAAQIIWDFFKRHSR